MVLGGANEIEVTEQLFRQLCPDIRTTDHFTYGKPPVDVYLEGKKASVKQRQTLSAEALREFEIKEQRKEAGLV